MLYRQPLMVQRQRCIGSLTSLLLSRAANHDSLTPVLTLRKGFRLLSRSLPLLNEVCLHLIFAVFSCQTVFKLASSKIYELSINL